jgi:hypothetical protein
MRLYTSNSFENSYLFPDNASNLNFCYYIQPALVKTLLCLLDFDVRLNKSVVKFVKKEQTHKNNFPNQYQSKGLALNENELQLVRSHLDTYAFATYRSRLARILSELGYQNIFNRVNKTYSLSEDFLAKVEILSNHELILPFSNSYRDYDFNITIASATLGSDTHSKILQYIDLTQKLGSVPSYSELSESWGIDKSSGMSAFFKRLPSFFVSTFARVVWAHGFILLDPSKSNFRKVSLGDSDRVFDSSGNGICPLHQQNFSNFSKKQIMKGELPESNILDVRKLSSSYVLLLK